MTIPRLEDLTMPQRIVLTAVIVIVVILALSIVGMFTAEGETPQEPFPSKFESRLIELDESAVEEAYKKHIVTLFNVWVTDAPHSSGGPARAVIGANNARSAFNNAMLQLERRKEKLDRDRK